MATRTQTPKVIHSYLNFFFRRIHVSVNVRWHKKWRDRAYVHVCVSCLQYFILTYLFLSLLKHLRAQNGQFHLSIKFFFFFIFTFTVCLSATGWFKILIMLLMRIFLPDGYPFLHDGDNDKCWVINMKIICYLKCLYVLCNPQLSRPYWRAKEVWGNEAWKIKT